MDIQEKAIYKVLEGYTRIRFNRLKRVVVEEKGLMSDRPFRETLKQMVANGLVKKIKIEKQHVEYTIKFDDLEYEQKSIDDYQVLFTEYEKILDKFIEKREKKSKIGQADFIITFLKSIYMIEFWFKEFAYARKNPEIGSLRIKFQDVKDLAESIAVDDGWDEERPNSDIFETVNNIMISESIEMLKDLRQNLVEIK